MTASSGLNALLGGQRAPNNDDRIDDRNILWAFVALVSLAVLFRHLSAFQGSFFQQVINGFGLNAGELLFILSTALVIARIPKSAVLTVADLFLISIASIFLIIPGTPVALLVVTISALYLVRRKNEHIVSIGQLFLALVIYEQWGRMFFNFIAPFVLSLETVAVVKVLQFVGNFSRDGIEITNSNGFSIFVETDCSAFHNLSLSTLIWLAAVKIESNLFRPAQFVALAAIYVATIVTNTVRIALIARSQDAYAYWHDGAGTTVVAMALGAIIIVSLYLSRERSPTEASA